MPENWERSARRGGTPGRANFPAPLVTDTEIFSEGGPDAVWTFKKGWDPQTEQIAEFSDPPPRWCDPDFDDSSWSAGETPIGFGDRGIVTELDDMRRNYVAFAARKRFFLTPEQLEESDAIVFTVKVDDGCIVFFNGEEIGRSVMDEPPGTEVPAGATAARHMEAANNVVEMELPKTLTRAGSNVLAVQIHNASVGSNDIAFIPALFSRVSRTLEPRHSPSVVINEVITHSAGGSRAVELYNAGGANVNLEGFSLSTAPVPDPDRGASWTARGHKSTWDTGRDSSKRLWRRSG